LAPLIDPNVHSCGTVRPHGHPKLTQPEPGFYAIGAKSYGRAPNFLRATGYEQARSVVAALAGDLAATDDVQLELPETGVCSVDFAREDATAAAAVQNRAGDAGRIGVNNMGASTGFGVAQDSVQRATATWPAAQFGSHCAP